MDLDFLSSMLDEVSLEGLDGITLTMMWKRLEDRPHFPIGLDDDSKAFLWECITVNKEIEFYELPEPREFVPPYNRYENIDEELGIVIEPVEKLRDSYSPIVPVKDGDIRGSCSTYQTRKCVTSIVRNEEHVLMSYTQAFEKWGDKLVLVASPRARLLALIGTESNPLLEFTLEAYCLLERIGRSRYLGEVTQGDDGLLSLNTSFCKQLHYYRKKLSNKGLITKQIHYLKNKRGTTSNGCLLHLTRFYVERKTKMECFMKALCDLLKDKPNNRESCAVARLELGIKKNTFKKLFYRPVQKWIQMLDIPHCEFYPNAPYKENYTTSGTPKIVKVVQLLKHYDEEKDDENEEPESRKDSVLPLNVYFDYSKVYYGYPFIHHIYDLIKNAGPNGISSADLGRKMTLPRLDIRNLLRVLMKKNRVISMLIDRGRQKVTQYIAKIYEKDNERYNIVKEHEMSCSETLAKDKNTSAKRKDILDSKESTPPPKKKVRFDDEIVEEESQPTDFQNIVSQVLELHNSELFSGRSPKVISILEQPPIPCPSSSVTQLTYTKLKRSTTILDYLNEVKFSTLGEIQKELKRREKDNEHQLCKRSTARLVHDLANSKKIKIFKVALKYEDKRTNLEFICDNSVEPTDQCIQVAIEQAKFKYFCVNKEKSKEKAALVKTSDPEIGKESKPEKEKIHGKPGPKTFSTVNHPKFVRARALHEFLYYLAYELRGPILKNDEQCVYHDSMSFKRFLPPLPELTDEKKEGWCFLADIYLRIPLSVFMKVVTISYLIPNLKEYLEDEEKQHYLIKYLPQDLRNSLLNNRKFMFSTHEVIKNLCYMGLVSMGPQIGKQKDQVFLYVHKNASIQDTTISSPGYIHVQANLEYELKQYTFKSLKDVDNFWKDLESICFRTQLGKYNTVAGKTFALTEAAYKPELKKCVENKGFEDVEDSGQIPGDGLGAAGYDSALFMHIKRNWVSSTMKKYLEIKEKIDSREVPTKYTLQHLLKIKNAPKPENRSRLQRLTKPTIPIKKEKEKQIQIKSPQRKPATPFISKRQKTKIRTINKRTARIRLPYYDDVDKVAMKKMKKARCEWCAQEDSFLLLCKVASLILDPLFSKNLVVPFTVVRDLLYEHLPEISEAKSSRACQRRVRYMMLNPATVSNVAVYLGEANQDEELVREFNVVKPPKTNIEVWKGMFTNLLNKLMKKFTLPPADRCKNITLPDSLEELNRRYDITYSRDILHQEQIHKDPKNISDIKTFVLSSLVLSVMSLSKNHAFWKYMLLQLYKSYPSSFLQSVIANLRRNKIIAVKKSLTKVDTQHINSYTPYKFSIIYENSLLTKFPIKMFKEGHNLIENFSTINPEAGVELKGDVPAGYASVVLSLATLQQLSIHTEIPEHIILFDTSLSKEARSNIVERIIHTLSDKESVELSKILNNESTSFSKPTDSESTAEEVKFSPEDPASDEDSNVSQSVTRTSNASRYALYLLRQEKAQPPIERTQHSQDYIVLNSCRLFCQMRANCDVALTLNPPDILEQMPDTEKVIQSDTLSYDKTHLVDNSIKEISELLTFYIPPSALTISEDTVENSLNVLYKDYSLQTLKDAKFIFNSINEAGVKGLVEKSLWKKCNELQGDLFWNDHLQLLRKAFLIIRTGIMAFTYVSIFHAEVWLLESCLWSEQMEQKSCGICGIDFKSLSSDQDQVCNHEQPAYFESCEKVYFIPRSWRNPDGTLNKTAFFELLNTVLSHIISTPSISVKDICERFVLTMQPVQVLELIEILEKANCIYRYYYKPTKKSSLFSKPQVAYITENPGPDCIDHLENFPDAICKISKLYNSL